MITPHLYFHFYCFLFVRFVESYFCIDFQIEHALSDPKHDFYKFGTGNIETLQEKPKNLGINVRQELLNFHKKWYSANIMSLAVVGNQSLDELEETVVELFSGKIAFQR